MEQESIYGDHLPQMEMVITLITERIDAIRQKLRGQIGMDPVEHCLSRIKSEESMREKCRRKNLPETTASALEKIRDAILASPAYADSPVPFALVPDFDEAVKAAAASAETGDIVLLSPACASFDHFKNFAERGEHFKKLVMELE